MPHCAVRRRRPLRRAHRPLRRPALPGSSTSARSPESRIATATRSSSCPCAPRSPLPPCPSCCVVPRRIPVVASLRGSRAEGAQRCDLRRDVPAHLADVIVPAVGRVALPRRVGRAGCTPSRRNARAGSIVSGPTSREHEAVLEIVDQVLPPTLSEPPKLRRVPPYTSCDQSVTYCAMSVQNAASSSQPWSVRW